MILAVVLAMQAAATDVNWQYLSTAGNGEIWYIQSRPASAIGSDRIVWLKSDLRNVAAVKARTRVARVVIDCKNEGYTIAQSTEYLANGEALKTEQFPYTYIAPGSGMEPVMLQVCKSE